jgi:hypothetical protein
LEALRIALGVVARTNDDFNFSSGLSDSPNQVEASPFQVARSDLYSSDLRSRDLRSQVGGAQEGESSIGGLSASLTPSNQVLEETVLPLTLHSTSLQPATSSSIAGLSYDHQIIIPGSPSRQTPRGIQPTLDHLEYSSNDGQSFGHQTDLIQSQPNRDFEDDFMGSDQNVDSMEVPAFNVTYDDSGPTNEVATAEFEFHLDGHVDSDSLTELLNFENNTAGAMSTWESKNDGNKYLNPSWNPH